MACLDATSLLLRDVSTVDAASVKARLDGWDTAVVANELVEIFERLQLVESSFQSRADSKTKALASGIFDDLFVRLPDIGAQLMRDCQSSGLIARFTDIGIKILSDKVKLRAEAMQSAAAAKNEGNGTAPGSDKADDKGESPSTAKSNPSCDPFCACASSRTLSSSTLPTPIPADRSSFSLSPLSNLLSLPTRLRRKLWRTLPLLDFRPCSTEAV